MWIPFFLSSSIWARPSLPHPPGIPTPTCRSSVSTPLLILYFPSNACFSHLQNPTHHPIKKLFHIDCTNWNELLFLCHHFVIAFTTVGIWDGYRWGVICLFEMEPMSQCSWYPSITQQHLAQNKPVFIVGLFHSTLLDAMLFSLVLPSLPLVSLFHMQWHSTLNTSTINNRDGRLWTSPNLQTDTQKSQ